jgi:large repetitive protein
MVHDHAPRIEVLAAICLFIASFTFVVAPLTSAQPTLGTGASMFLPPVTYSSGGSQPFSIALADVNGDGKHDIVVANYQSGTVGLLLGNGDGTFRPAVIDAAGTAPSGVAVADVNGDGRPDIVVANACQSAGNCTYGAISLLLGNGDGTFQPATSYNSGSGQPNQVALADLNGDGKLDVVVSIWDGSEDEFGFSAVGVFLVNADGTFQPIVKEV